VARILNANDLGEELRKRLLRSFQSGNINFLLGSGASLPAIPTAGLIEVEIAEMISAGRNEEAYARMYAFLKSVHEPTKKLINDEECEDNLASLRCYEALLTTIEEILLARRTTILPRQATVFTTNYDLFLEKASAACPSTIFNDGFSRSPSLGHRMDYSSRNFFRATYNTGNLYDYRVEMPCINLIKLHGSLSWQKDKDGILLRLEAVKLLDDDSTHEDRVKFTAACAVVLPQAAKFHETLMDRTYYDLLRIYANSLDRENTVLIVFGFSFGDEHIRDITMRALKNPTLRLMLYAFNSEARDRFAELFQQYSNVEIIAPGAEGELQFKHFNDSLSSILRAGQA
jgi:SIR2-like domain